MKTEPNTKPAHSPEPWKPFGMRGMEDTHGIAVAEVYRTTGGEVENRNRIIACVNAMRGLNPEAIADVVAALEGLNKAYGHPFTGENGNSGECWDNARAALAKLRQ